MIPQTRREFLLTAALLSAGCRRRTESIPTVRTVAGTGTGGYEPEGQTGRAALETPVDNPYGVVAGPGGRLYFCEVDTGRTRRLDLAAGLLTTVAGDGEAVYRGDGLPALRASFSAPHEIRFDRDGHLFVVERDAHVVRRVDAETGIVSTIAGTGDAGFSGDGGPATAAMLRQPHSIAFDARGNLLVCDIGNQRVRIVDMATGTINTYAGTGERGPTPDSAPIAGTPLAGPRSLDTDGDGNIYLVLREGNAVFRIDDAARRLQRIAGTGEQGFGGDGGPADLAALNGPKGIAYSREDQSLYVVDTENHAIRRVDLLTGIISTVLGTGERGDGPDGDPAQCSLARPHGVFMHNGVLYVTDSENHRVRAVDGLV